MSPFFKKIVAITAATVLVAQNSAPFSAHAEAKSAQTATQSAKILPVQTPDVLKARLKTQNEALAKSGKISEYSDVKIKWDDASSEPSQIRWLKKKASADVAKDVAQVFDDLAPLYSSKKSAKKEKPILRATKDAKANGERHVRMKQSYAGLEIIGGELVAHVDEAGNLSQIDGDYVPEIKIPTVPKIKWTKALAPAIAKYADRNGFKLTAPKLAILSESAGQNLVWSYEASFEDPKEGMSRIRYDIDAETGKTVRSYDLIAHGDSPATIQGKLLPTEGWANVTLSGTYNSEADRYYIFDGVDRKTYVYNISTNSGTYVDSEDIANRPTSDWGNSDPTEISAGYNLQKTLDFFKPFGFTVNDVQFSSTGQTMAHFVVHYGTNYNNAFWSSGNGFYFGDGDGVNMTALTTLDVIAHEFGHAWTENTSNLVYENEPGALNESFSDIVGSTVELMEQADDRASYPNSWSGKADWLIGEDIFRIPGNTEISLRDMKDPANAATVGAGNEQPTKYKGTYWYSGTGDNGGVHQNSGVQNFFYYLLAEGWQWTNDGLLYSVDGIGLSNAWQVAFAANSYYVTSNTDYAAVRQAWIDAANSVNPAWSDSVANAWDAVWVYASVDYPAFAVTSDESFENGNSLPSGWATDSGSWAWSVSTSTWALGTNSLVSGPIGNSSVSNVTYGATTETGYVTFRARTSTEKDYDFLKFYVDGVLKGAWSGENAWFPSSFAIDAGVHEFKWAYAKDAIYSTWSDLAGIDAVHVESVTWSVGVASDTGSGNVFSKNGLHAVISLDGTWTYLFEDANLGTISRATASGTVSVPLPNASEGTNVVRFQYKNAKNLVSRIMERSFFVDGVDPAKPSFETASVSGSSQNVDFAWTATSDTGAWLPSEPYFYEVSQVSDFSNVTVSGSTSATWTTLTLPEGTSYVRVTAYDVAGNAARSDVRTAFVDSVAPEAPTNLQLNGGSVIWTGTVSNVTMSWLAGTGETNGTVRYEVSDRYGHSLSGTLSVGGDGGFSTVLDLSWLSDGMIDFSASVTDSVGNAWAVSLGSVGKSVMPADGTVEFLSGAYVGANTTKIRISASKNVSFETSGDLASTSTGDVAGGSNAEFDAVLSPGDGNKNVVVAFTDEGGVVTYASASVTVDTTDPQISITSHVDGGTEEGASVTLTGNVYEDGGVATFVVGGQSMAASAGNWSKTLPLPAGDTAFTATVTDRVGRTASTTVTITRTPVTSNAKIAEVTASGFTVTFDTDVQSLGYVAYGTDGTNFPTTVTESSSGTSHSVSVTWIADGTSYYAKAYAAVNGKNGSETSAISASTPKSAGIADYGNEIVATGSVWFEDSTATGAEFGSSSGTVTVYSEDGKHSASFPLGWLVIGTSWWDGKFSAPKAVAVSGSVIEPGYGQTWSVYAIGNDVSRLAFSGKTVTVRIEVGNSLNGKNLRAYHSNDGITFDFVASCAVAYWICEFEADHFSYYAFAAPNDSIPDSFSFAPKSWAEFGTDTVSDAVTLTGFNLPTSVSVIGGAYSVNNAAFTTATGTVNSGDSVRVKLVSSAVSLGSASATLGVWGVNSTFTVTSKQAVSGGSSSGGGGGGGGGGGSVPMSPVRTGIPTGSGAVREPVKNGANVKKNVKASGDPYVAAIEIAKSTIFAKPTKNTKTMYVPAWARPKIDRLVTDRIIKSIKLEWKSAKEKAALLEKASASVAKIARSKNSQQEKAVFAYVSGQLKKKAAEILKKASSR